MIKKEVKCPACGESFVLRLSSGLSAVYCHYCKAKIKLD